ncbi:hypothetical protein L917_11283 [Phytophthora nicotianae]|uniref:Uncharacterized protein n=1 Tax=Phytophthora nicotianae TaxID=4792 RepID=W2KZ39_PHYNI|nr:hypothetical protein L917_11283 [Phytophthora nicotianae]
MCDPSLGAKIKREVSFHFSFDIPVVSINPKPARPSILTVLRDITSTLVNMIGAREAYEVSGAEEGGATTRYQFR